MLPVVKPSVDAIDALLPQTQCGQCGYPGCRPYATAISEGAPIHLCPPGGISGLEQLSTLTGIAISPEAQLALQERIKPSFVVRIREEDCIGCTKCIQACPVDAIFGSAKQMHVILEQDCTGCELCIEPCPVDCIEQVTATALTYQPKRAKAHYEAKLARGAFKHANTMPTPVVAAIPLNSLDKKQFIRDAIARAKAKKSQHSV